MHGGERIAEVLKARGTPFVFTLCGGHISPILVGCKQRGIRVVDVRHEATAVFAADAVARLTGRPGAAAVTAGPGATNTITAVKNAQMAQSPVLLLVGATATALKGRGALQDIDQLALLKPHVKRVFRPKRLRDVASSVEQALDLAGDGVPGPVAVECAVDLLYPESVVRDWYGTKSKGGRRLGDRLIQRYLEFHVNRLFGGADGPPGVRGAQQSPEPAPPEDVVRRAAARLAAARRPLLLVGSQALVRAADAAAVSQAVGRLGLPVYLSGMARGLLGRDHPLQMRHRRRDALKQADLVILAGVPCDFRLDYGRQIRRGTFLVAANRSPSEMRKNRRPDLAIRGDAGRFLRQLSERTGPAPSEWQEWIETLRERDREREQQIGQQADQHPDALNPLRLCQQVEAALDEDSVVVADGGDFVATASYIVRPRGPLSWLDPGAFGTLGVGAGFALGAKLCRPDSEVWILYGDGSAGYSLTEFDTFARHGLPIVALVGNDGCWTQIAREQVPILGDDVGCALRRTDYHVAAEGYGGRGFLLTDSRQTREILDQAKRAARGGAPVLVNAHIGKTEFRKGSISM